MSLITSYFLTLALLFTLASGIFLIYKTLKII